MSEQPTAPGAGTFIGRELECAMCGANSFTIADLEPVRCPVCGAMKKDSYAIRPEWQTDAARQWKRNKLGADFLEWPVWLRRAWLHLLRHATEEANRHGATLEDLPPDDAELLPNCLCAFVPIAADGPTVDEAPAVRSSYLASEDAECLRRLMEWRRSRDHGFRDPRFKAANDALTPGIMMRLGELVAKALEARP